MNLMLAVMLVCVVTGLLHGPFGRRRQQFLAALAVVMTALYFLFGRLM